MSEKLATVMAVEGDTVTLLVHDGRTTTRLPVADCLADGDLHEGMVGVLHDGELFEVDGSHPAELLRFSRAKKGALFFTRDGSDEEVRIPREDFGFTNDDQARTIAEQHGGRLVRPAGGAAFEQHWLFEGGVGAALETVRATQQQERDQEKMNRELAELRRFDYSEWFINPYTFVPLPVVTGAEELDRGEAATHARQLTDHRSGTIEITWELLTPLLVRIEEDGAGGRWSPPLRDGRPLVPGSSMKGALRALHETMAGGCLRVFEDDFLPAYRDPAVVRTGTWRLARVEEVDGNGRPTVLRTCTDHAWVDASILRARLGGVAHIKTGATLNVTGSNRVADRDIAGADQVDPGTDWVMLVTDAAARAKQFPYYVATGKLGPDTQGINDAVWRRYQQEVDGAEDVRTGLRRKTREKGADHVPVEFNRQVIGHRRPHDERLYEGDVVWVEMSGRGIKRMTLSVLWRSLGAVPMGERVPKALHACTRPDARCPSCRIFGSIDETAASVEETQQRGERAGSAGVRGHVRIGDALAAQPTRLEQITLAGQGTPSPGAGQMYLEHRPGKAASKEELPAATWGSKLDGGKPRSMRGRKVYWHGDPTKQTTPRHIAVNGEGQTTPVSLIPAGTSLTQTITFDNLTDAELGGLLATIDPGLLLAAPTGYAETTELAIRIGGGKALGLGSVKATAVAVTAHAPADRYLDRSTPTRVDSTALVQQFEQSVPQAVQATWPDLAAVLSFGHVDPKWITYPPGTDWTQSHTENFRAGIKGRFWKKSNGAYPADAVVTRLPAAREMLQALPMEPEQQELARGDGR